ncbi:hypothetical protein C8J56DRAFT_1040250 [Mycena floridula]|nr:hypothetical protein C8J56DRAFT_1040250 [Mycena floridula]
MFEQRLQSLAHQQTKLENLIAEICKAKEVAEEALCICKAVLPPVRKLPNEVILEILCQAAEAHNPFNKKAHPWVLSQIYQRCTTTAMACPELWSSLRLGDCRHFPSPAAMRKCLENSATQPLKIEFEFAEHSSWMPGLFGPIKGRLQSNLRRAETSVLARRGHCPLRSLYRNSQALRSQDHPMMTSSHHPNWPNQYTEILKDCQQLQSLSTSFYNQASSDWKVLKTLPTINLPLLRELECTAIALRASSISDVPDFINRSSCQLDFLAISADYTGINATQTILDILKLTLELNTLCFGSMDNIQVTPEIVKALHLQPDGSTILPRLQRIIGSG